MSMDIAYLAHQISIEREQELTRTREHRRIAEELDRPTRVTRARRHVARGIRHGWLVTLRHVTEPPALAS